VEHLLSKVGGKRGRRNIIKSREQSFLKKVGFWTGICIKETRNEG